jgi:hypothetical protein
MVAVLMTGLLALCALFLLGRYSQPAVVTTHAVIELRVNGGEKATIAPGTPLIFTVALRGSEKPGRLIGSEKTPWHELLSVKFMRVGAAVDVAVPAIGRSRSQYLFGDVNGHLSWKEETSVAIELRSEAMHLQRFALGPEATADPGQYSAQAHFSSPVYTSRTPNVEAASNDVVVTVVRADDENVRRRLERERLLLLARYNLIRGQHMEATRAAEQLVSLDPNSSEGWLLLGDARASEKRDIHALDAYERALELVRRRREPPVEILNRISAVMRPARSK